MSLKPTNSNIAARVKALVEHHGGVASFIERLQRDGKTAPEDIIKELVKEGFGELDVLKANEMLALANEDGWKDSSAIANARVAAINQVIKSLQAQIALEKSGSVGIDVESPAMRIVLQFFLNKVQDVFREIKIDAMVSDAFFIEWKKQMKSWKKELNDSMNEKAILETEARDATRALTMETEDEE